MDNRRPLTPNESLVVGLLLLCYSAVVIAVALFRPRWLQRPGWRWLTRWGRLGFPASPVGVLAGGGVGLGISLSILDTYFEMWSKEVRLALVLVPLLLAVAAAVYDFRLHRRRSREGAARNVPVRRRLPVAKMGLPDLYAALRRGDAEESLVEAALRRRAAEEPKAFASFLRTIEFDEDCALWEVYVALADEAEDHVDVLLSELERLLSVAEQNPGNRWIFDQLMVYEFSDGPDALRRGISAAVLRALGSPVPQIRRCAACLAVGFLSASIPALEGKLREVHSRDTDWRVRALAYQSLSDYQATDHPDVSLPERSFGDRIRSLVFGASVRDFTA